MIAEVARTIATKLATGFLLRSDRSNRIGVSCGFRGAVAGAAFRVGWVGVTGWAATGNADE